MKDMVYPQFDSKLLFPSYRLLFLMEFAHSTVYFLWFEFSGFFIKQTPFSLCKLVIYTFFLCLLFFLSDDLAQQSLQANEWQTNFTFIQRML